MSNWYADMAAAMQKRQVAINGRERWQTKVEEAEAEIAELTRDQRSFASDPIAEMTPRPVATFSGVPADYSETAE